MKRFFFILFAALMAVNLTDSAMAQDVAQKTRYVYLWDLTGSIDSGTNRENDLYGKMFRYMDTDIRQKASGTEIVIIPFNDGVLDVLKYTVINSNDIRAGKGSIEIEFNDLKDYGFETVKRHKRNGHTDIADAINHAQNTYVSDGYNTIFILLTDGGQEYYSVNGGKNFINIKKEKDEELKQKVRERLETSLCNIDTEISGTDKSFNHVYYVEFVADKNFDADKVDRETSHITFINANNGFVNLHLCEITPEIAADNNTISCRDRDFEIHLKTNGDASKLAQHVNVKVYEDQKSLKHKGISRQQNDFCIELLNPGFNSENECKFNYELSIDDIKDDGNRSLRVDDGNDIYIYWFNKDNRCKLELTVTRAFKPMISVKLK